MATEAEISAPIVFLLSEAAAFITGSVLRVDGGRPQMRAGWFPGRDAPASEQAAVHAYDGFPLARLPKLLQQDEE
jgi:citronellol/citronellal dehydrogenase